ncbi:MAG: hypothetical protein QG641_689 [Candidatus Poribacteria bacterium]|nr:hypothetical protein [Candidatus Poribacteria bacterium]MDQ1327409.1 hypothetical protein [Candidatus Poribacteria bacterium]
MKDFIWVLSGLIFVGGLVLLLQLSGFEKWSVRVVKYLRGKGKILFWCLAVLVLLAVGYLTIKKIMIQGELMNAVLVIRWIARVSTILVVGIGLTFLVGEGLGEYLDKKKRGEEIKKLPIGDLIDLSCFPVMATGLLIAWKWEMIGVIISIFGFLALWVYWVIDRFPEKFPPKLFVVFPTISLLYLCSWVLSKSTH